MTGTYAHAPGFIVGDRPKIVTSRFEYEDSYTLTRYLATDGYRGLRAALSRPANEVHDEVRTATVLGAAAQVSLLEQNGVSLRKASTRVISLSMATRVNQELTKIVC